MSDDLVARLREHSEPYQGPSFSLIREAADEIDRLRAALERMFSDTEKLVGQCHSNESEIERLRAESERLTWMIDWISSDEAENLGFADHDQAGARAAIDTARTKEPK